MNNYFSLSDHQKSFLKEVTNLSIRTGRTITETCVDFVCAANYVKEKIGENESPIQYRIEQPTIDEVKKEFPNISEMFIVWIYNYITTRQNIVEAE